MNFFKRLLLKSAPCSSTVACEESKILQECILLIRPDIPLLQDRINTSFANLQIIIRCINSLLPGLESQYCHHHYQMSLTELENVVKDLGKKYARKPFRSSKPPRFANSALEALAVKGEGAVKNLAHEKEEVSLDVTAVFMPMVSEKGKLQTELNLLVLQKAELGVEADVLEGNLFFWAGVWEDILSACKLKSSRSSNEIMKLRMQGDGKSGPSTIKSVITRKEVPVKEILHRLTGIPPQEERLSPGFRPTLKSPPPYEPVQRRHDSGFAMKEDEEKFFDCAEAL